MHFPLHFSGYEANRLIQKLISYVCALYHLNICFCGRFALNDPGNGLMVLACLLVDWMSLVLTFITTALVVTTLSIKRLPLDLGHKLQKPTWNVSLRLSWILHVKACLRMHSLL